MPEVQSVDAEDEYIHVRFQDPDRYETIRTPDWAENAAQSVSENAEVRTGKQKDADDWEVQSVLIRKTDGEQKATKQATKIVDKIES